MQIAFASDLHLEFHDPKDRFSPLREARWMDGADPDVLVLAGDIDVEPRCYADLLRDVRQVFSGPMVLVLGNHEFYHQPFPGGIERYREAVAFDPLAHILERQSVVIGGVRFLGTTLWTDFAKGRHWESCIRGMNDFRSIDSVEVMREHVESIQWLDRRCTDGFSGKTVVVTHHAPSFRSQHPRFAGSSIGGGFCSDMDLWVESWKPELWIHGHLHDPVDYWLGGTRVISNPWGYPQDNRDRCFRVVEV
jgi:predicted phosphodiesterase